MRKRLLGLSQIIILLAGLSLVNAIGVFTATTTTPTTTSLMETTIQTAVTTTTTLGIPACIGKPIIDPYGEVDSLPPAKLTTITILINGTGVFDVFVDDGGVGGNIEPSVWLPAPSSMLEFNYTSPKKPPQNITITVRIEPHSIGYVCGYGSQGGSDSKTFPTTNVGACSDYTNKDECNADPYCKVSGKGKNWQCVDYTPPANCDTYTDRATCKANGCDWSGKNKVCTNP